MNFIEPQLWNAKYHCYLQKIALSKINDPEQARDLVQDTFLAALEGQKHFKGNSSERTWLTAILLHKVMDLYRKEKAQQKKQKAIIAAHTCQQTCISQEEMLSHKELLKTLKRKLTAMPLLWADVFQLKYMEEAPTDFICRQLDITTSNFWTISHRSRLQIRNYLKNAG